MYLFLLALIAFAFITAFLWSLIFKIDYLSSLSISVPLSIGLSFLCQFLLTLIGVHIPIDVLLIFWVLSSLLVMLRALPSFSRNIENSRVKTLLHALAVGTTSVAAWSFGIGWGKTPPRDNDAIVHLFSIRYLSQNPSSGLCQIARDSLFVEGLRFVPCGGHQLAASYLRYFDVSPIELLNGLYLLGAFFLPVGVYVFFRNNRELLLNPVIAALISISMLNSPYGINGLLPFSLGLAFLVPSIGCFSLLRHNRLHLFFLIFPLSIGLFLIHPLPGIVFLGAQMISLFLMRDSIGGSKLIFLAVLIIPVIMFQENATSLIQGIRISNSSETVNSSLFSIEHFLWGSVWTRPQPILCLLMLGGIFLLLKSDVMISKLFGVLASFMSLLWVTSGWNHSVIRFVQLPFYGQWYRILAVLSVVSVVPIGMGLSVLIDSSSKRPSSILRVLMLASIFSGITISIVTGGRIVDQAWGRSGQPSQSILEEMRVLQSYQNLRLLNNPLDGSLWSYAISGTRLSAATTRGVDIDYSSVVDSLTSANLNYACSVASHLKLDGLVLISPSVVTTTKLLNTEVVYQPLIHTKEIYLAKFSKYFLSACSTVQIECAADSEIPKWYRDIRDQRFPSFRCS